MTDDTNNSNELQPIVTKNGLEKYAKNPFLRMSEIQTRKSQVKITKDGSDDQILLNRTTGECATTHVVSYREVDNAEFIKLFTANIALTFNLSPAGRKVFDLLLRVMQNTAIGKDQVYLNDETRKDALEEFPDLKLSLSTYKRGIDDLISNSIIARSTKVNVYFINPHLIFNGDRVAFTQAIKRKNSSKNKETLSEQKERLNGIKERGGEVYDDDMPI